MLGVFRFRCDSLFQRSEEVSGAAGGEVEGAERVHDLFSDGCLELRFRELFAELVHDGEVQEGRGAQRHRRVSYESGPVRLGDFDEEARHRLGHRRVIFLDRLVGAEKYTQGSILFRAAKRTTACCNFRLKVQRGNSKGAIVQPYLPNHN